jgi:hypothetical protein
VKRIRKIVGTPEMSWFQPDGMGEHDRVQVPSEEEAEGDTPVAEPAPLESGGPGGGLPLLSQGTLVPSLGARAGERAAKFVEPLSRPPQRRLLRDDARQRGALEDGRGEEFVPPPPPPSHAVPAGRALEGRSAAASGLPRGSGEHELAPKARASLTDYSQSYLAFMEELDDLCHAGFASNLDREIERRRKCRRNKEDKKATSGFDDDADEEEEDELEPSFGLPRGGQQGLAVIARTSPGALYRKTLLRMAEQLQLRRSDADQSTLRSRFAVYLNTVMIPSAQSPYTMRMLREMRTLAAALDHLSKGEVLEAADILAQRFKALEASHEDQAWDRATLAEVVPEQGGLITEEERYRMSQQAAFEKKLVRHESRSSSRARSGSSPRAKRG